MGAKVGEGRKATCGSLVQSCQVWFTGASSIG
jgi:hypothetical protein